MLLPELRKPISREVRSLFKDLPPLDLFTSQKLPGPVPVHFIVLDCRKVDPAFASDFRIRERLYRRFIMTPCLRFSAHLLDRQPMYPLSTEDASVLIVAAGVVSISKTSSCPSS